MKKKWLVSLSLAGIIAFTAACSNEGENTESNEDQTEPQEEVDETAGEEGAENAAGGEQQMEMPEPDLEDVPDVVAEVNGVEISKEDYESLYVSQFQQTALQYQMSGQELDQDQFKEQIMESMIGQELLVQEVEKSDLEASEDKVNETLDGLVAQNEMETQEEFFAALEEQGMDKTEVMSQVELQVKLDQLIANEAGEVEVTEEELQALYDQAIAQQEESGAEGAEIPSFEEAKPSLEQQIRTQKETETTQELVNKLREDAEVTIHL
ncbi:SurA N-terminal domain-containing protein [Aquibacillus koreensis]|uniref:peptidylprolyl isomerase n=1 Tax=Aquibacillus koreensis TaxID=279446 RepID=A0A9X3WM74_9BACI|nr:SurA N-terminal domain-containing protein [Aquibacillus koreensis]MCT2536684.1 SurA N-terminal domain-containing protein [Aquibacillus koreensis]MDC3422637.1 SurA N-terminal domain-containing protein [Aquibacillus koreensis]